MFENITVIILAIVAFSAGIWSWWFTNQSDDVVENTEETQDE